MPREIPITTARHELTSLPEQLSAEPGTTVAVTRRGKPVLAILSWELYESIQDLFAREGIHFAHRQVTVRLEDGQKTENLSEQEKKAVSAAARTILDEEQAAALAKKGGAGDR